VGARFCAPVHTRRSGWLNVAGNKKTYWSLHVNCPILLPNFNQIWILSADCNESLQYQISRQSVQWEPCAYLRTDGRTDGHEANTRL
jgi:hypothetical protein